MKDLTWEEAQKLCEERELAIKIKEKLDKEEEMSAWVRLLDLGKRYIKDEPNP